MQGWVHSTCISPVSALHQFYMNSCRSLFPDRENIAFTACNLIYSPSTSLAHCDFSWHHNPFYNQCVWWDKNCGRGKERKRQHAIHTLVSLSCKPFSHNLTAFKFFLWFGLHVFSDYLLTCLSPKVPYIEIYCCHLLMTYMDWLQLLLCSCSVFLYVEQSMVVDILNPTWLYSNKGHMYCICIITYI